VSTPIGIPASQTGAELFQVPHIECWSKLFLEGRTLSASTE
jgi:hypothetical protein